MSVPPDMVTFELTDTEPGEPANVPAVMVRFAVEILMLLVLKKPFEFVRVPATVRAFVESCNVPIPEWVRLLKFEAPLFKL